MSEVINEVTSDMRARTDGKFLAWDDVVAKNMLTGEDWQREIAWGLLKDPTIFAYAFFKDREGNPLRLYPYQDAIINDESRRIIFAAARQIGKSTTLDLKAVHYALLNPGKTVLLVSKTLPQSKDLLREIRRLLNGSTFDSKSSIGDSENKTEISFRHYEQQMVNGKMVDVELDQSRILCVPATEAGLGYAAHLVLIDELAFYEDSNHFYFQIIQPTTYKTRGQIICFSNPDGQKGVFWELWNSPEFSRYQFKFLDCPGNTQEDYDSIARGLTQQQIDSTLDAKFTDPEGGFLTSVERNKMQEERYNGLPPVLTRPVFIFFDFAKSGDRTVRGIGVPTSDDLATCGVNVLEMYEYPHATPYNVIVDDLEALIQQVGFDRVALVGWDNTGVGAGIEDFIGRISKLGVKCCPVEFTLQNKSRIYTLLKLLIEKNLRGEYGIKIPYVPECDKQLATLRFKKTGSNRYLQVHHENERDRDDFPDMLAGLCSLIIQPEYIPVKVMVVGDEATEKHFAEEDSP